MQLAIDLQCECLTTPKLFPIVSQPDFASFLIAEDTMDDAKSFAVDKTPLKSDLRLVG